MRNDGAGWCRASVLVTSMVSSEESSGSSSEGGWGFLRVRRSVGCSVGGSLGGGVDSSVDMVTVISCLACKLLEKLSRKLLGFDLKLRLFTS